eukprot:Skav212033  [mRNA]  locus=scaffold1285:141061:144631:+ [translate_table: standard]
MALGALRAACWARTVQPFPGTGTHPIDGMEDGADRLIELPKVSKGDLDNVQHLLLVGGVKTFTIQHIKIQERLAHGRTIFQLVASAQHWDHIDIADLATNVNKGKQFHDAPKAAQIRWTTKDNQF